MKKNVTKTYQCALSNGERVELTLYPELWEAIDYHWDSLYFPYNEETFATAVVGDQSYQLVTNGDICIYDQENECEVEINKEIIHSLLNTSAFADTFENEEGYLEDKYYISQSNSFEILSGDCLTGETLEATPFYESPKNQFEFIQLFLTTVESLHFS